MNENTFAARRPNADGTVGPLNRAEVDSMPDGFGLRIVAGTSGIVTEGVIENRAAATSRTIDRVTVRGREFVISADHSIFAVRLADVRPRKDPVRELTDAEVFAKVDELGTPEGGGKPIIVSRTDIIVSVLGFDPADRMPVAAYGGRSPEAYRNQFIRAGKLKASLDHLVASGEIKHLTAPSRLVIRPVDTRAVTFPYETRSGYVTARAHKSALQALAVRQRAVQLEKYEAAAINTVATRYPDEVAAEIARLIAAE